MLVTNGEKIKKAEDQYKTFNNTEFKNITNQVFFKIFGRQKPKKYDNIYRRSLRRITKSFALCPKAELRTIEPSQVQFKNKFNNFSDEQLMTLYQKYPNIQMFIGKHLCDPSNFRQKQPAFEQQIELFFAISTWYNWFQPLIQKRINLETIQKKNQQIIQTGNEQNLMDQSDREWYQQVEKSIIHNQENCSQFWNLDYSE